ncbi:hypothetical protein [Streptacidiphilus rugosus]|uniref:hypothetical protein n=1 Tax=Streptacidiphilus rugosus TaxID=405783 RepID=UPI0012FC9AFA|nr:hypothetical protein [Streptacidiphilus rugosus]
MSLNRGVAALAGLVVVGAGIAAGGAAWGVSSGKPVPNVAVVAGSHWTQIAPLKGCYNDGKAMDQAAQAKCGVSIKAALTDEKLLPTAIVPSANSTFGINVDQPVVHNGWLARYSTGTLVQHTTNAYAGPLSTAQVLTTQDQSTGASTVGTNGPVLVVETDKSGNTVYGEWLFQLKVSN